MSPSENRSAANVRATEEALRVMRAARGEALLLSEVGRTVRRRRRAVAASGIGFAAVLTVVAWFGAGRLGSALGPTSPAVATAIVSEPRRQVLPDGSLVELRDDAEITTTFTAAERRVQLLRGEAYFAVTKDAARPFVVAASGAEVSAVGTSFSVGVGANAVDVVVTSGKVAVAAREVSAPATLLVPGQTARVVLAAPQVEIETLTAAQLGERLAWRGPQIEFSGTPLAEAVALVNARRAAHGGPRIVVDPQEPGLLEIRLSGFLAADNTEGFLLLLESSFGVRVERENSGLVRLRAAR